MALFGGSLTYKDKRKSNRDFFRESIEQDKFWQNKKDPDEIDLDNEQPNMKKYKTYDEYKKEQPNMKKYKTQDGCEIEDFLDGFKIKTLPNTINERKGEVEMYDKYEDDNDIVMVNSQSEQSKMKQSNAEKVEAMKKRVTKKILAMTDKEIEDRFLCNGNEIKEIQEITSKEQARRVVASLIKTIKAIENIPLEKDFVDFKNAAIDALIDPVIAKMYVILDVSKQTITKKRQMMIDIICGNLNNYPLSGSQTGKEIGDVIPEVFSNTECLKPKNTYSDALFDAFKNNKPIDWKPDIYGKKIKNTPCVIDSNKMMCDDERESMLDDIANRRANVKPMIKPVAEPIEVEKPKRKSSKKDLKTTLQDNMTLSKILDYEDKATDYEGEYQSKNPMRYKNFHSLRNKKNGRFISSSRKNNRRSKK